MVIPLLANQDLTPMLAEVVLPKDVALYVSSFRFRRSVCGDDYFSLL